jgi:hypothetical protein
MGVTNVDMRRAAQRKVRWLEPLTPWVLFAALVGGFAALVAAAHTRSLLWALVAGAALLVSVAGLAAWTLTTDGRATSPPKHIPWRRGDWTRFEQAFWAYVERSSE